MTDQLDVAKLIRVKAAIDATLAASTVVRAAPGLSSAYLTHRREVTSMLDGSLLEEFDRLYPEAHFSGARVFFEDLQREHGEVVVRMSGMSGWLDGIIQVNQAQRQLRANAQAYAREKVKAERGIGFKDPK